MNEARIESIVEKLIDKLDRRYMDGLITDEQYLDEVYTIDQWSAQEFKFSKPNPQSQE